MQSNAKKILNEHANTFNDFFNFITKNHFDAKFGILGGRRLIISNSGTEICRCKLDMLVRHFEKLALNEKPLREKYKSCISILKSLDFQGYDKLNKFKLLLAKLAHLWGRLFYQREKILNRDLGLRFNEIIQRHEYEGVDLAEPEDEEIDITGIIDEEMIEIPWNARRVEEEDLSRLEFEIFDNNDVLWVYPPDPIDERGVLFSENCSILKNAADPQGTAYDMILLDKGLKLIENESIKSKIGRLKESGADVAVFGKGLFRTQEDIFERMKSELDIEGVAIIALIENPNWGESAIVVDKLIGRHTVIRDPCEGWRIGLQTEALKTVLSLKYPLVVVSMQKK